MFPQSARIRFLVDFRTPGPTYLIPNRPHYKDRADRAKVRIIPEKEIVQVRIRLRLDGRPFGVESLRRENEETDEAKSGPNEKSLRRFDRKTR